MATGAAGDGILRGVFEGCISGHDMGIQRRPYHRNCSCALHKSKGNCSHTSKYNNVSYPIRRSWSESSVALMASGNSSPSSPSSSPAAAAAVAAADFRRSSRHFIVKEGEVGEPDGPASDKLENEEIQIQKPSQKPKRQYFYESN